MYLPAGVSRGWVFQACLRPRRPRSARTETYEGHTYHLVRGEIPHDGITWTEAESFAHTLGGHLVTINDAREQAWITNTFTPGNRLDFFLWIGLNDAAVEGEFVWSSGQPVTYTNWAPGEPNDFGDGEDYVDLQNFADRDFKWNDFSDVRLEQPGFGFSGLVEVPVIPEPSTAILLVGMLLGPICGSRSIA